MMKFLKFLSVILLTGIIFSACQKEYDIIDGTATGTLKENASGDCMPVVINGIYTTNVTLGAANFADIQVNIDNIGTYDIGTDTVNGYYFHAAASVAITGLNTIRLQAFGKPIIQGTDIFKVKFSGTACELNVSVGTGGGPGGTAAVFTLRAATTGAACTGAVQSGAYNQGLATSPSNTVTVFADVTTAGTYTATTTLVNGVSFSGSGTLAVGTNQPIILTANGGIPAAAGTFNYPVTAGTSTCNFDVIYGAALPQATITPDCSTVTVNGTYQAGTAMTSGNTVLVPVTVTTPGTYTITTATQNGVSFSGSGVVTAGTTSIILTASATTPTAAGTFTYPLTINGTSSCSVPVTFTAATGPAAILQGTINGTLITFNVMAHAEIDNSIPPFTILTITGNNNSSSSAAETISFDITSGSAITPGTYTINSPSPVTNCDYTDAASNDYEGFFDGTTQADPFTIVISTISTTRVTGTFKGTLTPLGGAPGTKIITGGTFNVPVQ
jgi:hypothetical protein